MVRVFYSALLLMFVVGVSGCGGVPSEATGTPVPDDYEEQQMKSQKAAQEAATKNAGKRR